MKNLSLFSFFFLSFLNFSYGQWNILNLFPKASQITVTNETDFYWIGEYLNGPFYFSHDGGDTWSSFQSEYDTEYFMDLDFVNDSVGFICGGGWFTPHRNIIMKTKNAGLTWETLTRDSIGIYQYVFSQIDFINEDSGMVIGYGNELLRTFDGGINWQSSFVDTTIASITDLQVINNQLGFMATSNLGNSGLSEIYRTTDFGSTWQLVHLESSNLLKIHFLNPSLGYVSGANGILLTTADGGNTWSSQKSSPFNSVDALWFTSTDTGYANIGGIIQKTVDGGSEWIPQTMSMPNIVSFIQFSNNHQIGYLLAGNLIYKTTNGGGITTQIKTPSSKLIFKIFPNPSNDYFIINYSSELNIKKITLLDAVGRMVKVYPSDQKYYNVSDLAPGTYFLKMVTNEGVAVEKVIVQ